MSNGDTEDFTDLLRGGRAQFVAQLAIPQIRNRLIAFTNAEVGTQGPEAKQAFMETILNRAISRRKNLMQILGGKYFPPETHAAVAKGVGQNTIDEYSPILDRVMGGSNVANFATGNASYDPKTGRNVGFAGGPEVAAYGGERFGIEGYDKDWWKTRLGYTGSGGPAPYTSPPSPETIPLPQPRGAGTRLDEMPPVLQSSSPLGGLAALPSGPFGQRLGGIKFQVPEVPGMSIAPITL